MKGEFYHGSLLLRSKATISPEVGHRLSRESPSGEGDQHRRKEGKPTEYDPVNFIISCASDFNRSQC